MKELYSFITEKDGKFFKYLLKKLGRVDRDEIQKRFASVRFQALRDGMPSMTMVNKIYDDSSDGVLSEKQKNLVNKLREDARRIQEKIIDIGSQKMKKADKEKETDRLANELEEIQRQMADLETFRNSIYEGTADYYARNKAIEYILLNFSFVAEHVGEGEFADPEPVFAGKTLDDKYLSYEDVEENGSDEVMEILTLISTFYWMGQKNEEEITEMLGIAGYGDWVASEKEKFAKATASKKSKKPESSEDTQEDEG